jgi:hypothetical protein
LSDTIRRKYQVGSTVDDLCRACKIVRRHTVMAAGPDGTPLRVVCDYCGSQHNFRGGRGSVTRSTSGGPRMTVNVARPLPLVDPRERSEEPMSLEGSGQDLELLLRRIIREEAGLTPATPADKWRGGDLILRPGREGLQEKTIPIETFFHKIVMVRNRLRVLEQQINGSDLPQETKVKLQGYITAAYGSLTGFNVLFADADDRFKGSGG